MRQADRRQATRERILQAARTLFERHGYEAASVDGIVAEAGVAKGTFYQHFETKIELAHALLRAEQAQMLPRLEARLAGGEPPLALLDQALVEMAKWFHHNRGLARPLLLHGVDRAPDSGGVSSRVLMERILAAAQRRGELRNDVAPRELALLLMASVLPLVLHWLSRTDQKASTLWKAFRHAWRLIYEGARVQPDSEEKRKHGSRTKRG